MASNYGEVVAQLQSAGLIVNSLEVTGRMVRCRVEGDREKRGWYVLHEITTDRGELLIVGSFGIWHGSENNARKVELSGTPISPEQTAALRKRMAEDRKRADAERKAAAHRAAERARKAWAACSETGESDYLKRKGVGAFGVRFSPSGAMVIPIADIAGNLHGLQLIRTGAQAKASKDKEYWPAGLAKKGHFHLIGAPRDGGVVLLVEGYATGASLRMATDLPVAIAFDANNLQPVAEALRKRYKRIRILVCADDDAFGKCIGCGRPVDLVQHPTDCHSCWKPHGRINAGVTTASTVAMVVSGGYVAPRFADQGARWHAFETRGTKLTDFNDLHAVEGLHVVRAQVLARITELGWDAPATRGAANGGAGKRATDAMAPITTLDELLDRFALVYGQGGQVFDHKEHTLIALSDMRDLCMQREIHRAWMEHPDRQIVRPVEVGFDPSGKEGLRCNLWDGWPTQAKEGRCTALFSLLGHLCGRDQAMVEWVIKWLAYPIQNPGAKMHTALVLHGGQGTGKNLFFETVMAIYGRYGRIVDQAAVEDKFNDWMSAKLFLIADEVVARSELFHVKNKLKSYITGEWVRINPKGMAARDERNRANFVFLSNEVRPVALEEDDRRHCVLYVPDKMPAEAYELAVAERDNGGIEAVHHALLTFPLGDFGPATKPPINQAKRDLIEIGLDSTSRFYHALNAGELNGLKPMPCRSEDLYEAYRVWCGRTGQRVAPQPQLIAQIAKKHAVPVKKARWSFGTGERGPHGICVLGTDREPPPNVRQTDWFGECVVAFRNAVDDYKGAMNG